MAGARRCWCGRPIRDERATECAEHDNPPLAIPERTVMPRFLVLVPRDSEWYAATRNGRLVTTTERTQIGLGSIEGRRPPVILVSADRFTVPTIDLVDLITGDVEPPNPPAPEGPPPGPPNPPRPPKDRPVG